MGISIEQVDYEHYLKYSIPLHPTKEELIFHLRTLADELEKKADLTSDRIVSIGCNTPFMGGSLPCLDVVLQKRIPFNRLDYFRHNTLETLIEERREQNKENE